MKIHRNFSPLRNGSIVSYSHIANLRVDFGAYVTSQEAVEKRRSFVQTASANNFYLPFVRISLGCSLRERFSPVSAVLLLIKSFPSRIHRPFITGLRTNQSVLNHQPTNSYYLSRDLLTAPRHIQYFDKKYFHQSTEKMVWPTEYDNQEDGSEVLFLVLRWEKKLIID